jgi:hypothetical protein
MLLADTLCCADPASNSEPQSLTTRLTSYVGKYISLSGMEQQTISCSLLGIYKDYFLVQHTVSNPPSQSFDETYSIPFSRMFSLNEFLEGNEKKLILVIK